MNKFKDLREKYRSKFPPSLVAAAVKIALDMGGAMTPAVKKIERMKKGLSDDPIVADALRQANESVKEGKYSKYSDLLLMKAKIIDKEGPKSNKLPAVNDAIRIELKKLGIKEGTVQEGTWAIPETKEQLKKLVDMLAKPTPATKPAQIQKFINEIPVGDDELYDDLEEHMYEKEGDDLKRPLKKVNSFDKIFLNVVAGESLNGRWLKGKTQGNKFIATHHYFSLDEAMVKRKAGKFRPKKMQRIEL